MAKITIDAGHGGRDSGAVGVKGRMEKADTLKMALALQKEMLARGHVTLMTRPGDTYPSLNERADRANSWKADVFISLHRNAFGDPNANGGETLYGRNASSVSVRLAEDINNRMNRAAGFKDRGAKRQGATVLERTKMPAVTVEAGFVTNAIDNSRLDNNFNAVIKAIADSLESVMGRSAAPQPVSPAPPTPGVGALAYVTINNARLWKDAGRAKDGTPVTLDAYHEGDAYARVKGGDNAEYLVAWAGLRSARG